MQAGALFGALLGVTFVIVGDLGPTPWRIMMLVGGVLLVVMATLVWERTRLPRWTAGIAFGACVAFSAAFLPGGKEDIQSLFLAYPLPTIAALLMPASLMFSESYFSKEKWQRVRERSESATLRDVLLFRHIPDLR